jgi:broad specificity phosphatase PhoE
MANRLLLVRHARVAARYAGRYIGSTDAPLGAEGRRQAKALAAAVAGMRIDKLMCSPMARAVATARPIAKATGLKPALCDDLREIDFGDWEAKTHQEVLAASPDAFKQWARFGKKCGFPGGSTLSASASRVRGLAKRLAADEAGDILIVTHGGVIRMLLCHFMGLRPRDYMRFQIDHGSLTTLGLYDGTAVLVRLNDMCHLA